MVILALFAHPDDESFGPAGTLAKYASAGHEVILVTFTRGEAGTLGISKSLGRQELARRRTEELKCAAQKLHIKTLRHLDYPDKGLSDIPLEEGVRLVSALLSEFQPDLVISFHHDGVSGHMDHRTVSRWTLETFKQGGSPGRLMHYGVTQAQAQQVTQRELLPMADDEITHVIDVAEFIETKIEAIRCHVTQLELWEKMHASGNGFTKFARLEHFSQMWPELKDRQIRHSFFPGEAR